MATRLLLTLLALVAGLAAQFTPAQARGVSASEVAVEIAQSDVRLVTRQGARRTPPATVIKPAPDCTILMLKRTVGCAPAVMLGIDRSRE
jgi:hypothetical protein